MRIAFYSVDLGPARNLMRVASVALDAGHRVVFIGNEEVLTIGSAAAMIGYPPDVLITGLASFKCEQEVQLGKAATGQGIPWVVFADTHRAWARPLARGKVEKATLIIASPAEIDAAREFGYGRVKYLGGPPLWQDFPKIKPAKIERHNPESRVILVSGIKDPVLTDRMLEVVVKACKNLSERSRFWGGMLLGQLGLWELIFKPHPNEDAAGKDPLRRVRILKGVQVIETPERTTNLLGTVNVSVHTGGATDTIAAAYLRAPAIFYEDDDVRARNEKQLGEPTWYPAEAGACLKAGPTTMVDAIHALLSENGRAALAKRQAEVYPIPPAGEPLVEARILKFLTELVGKK